MQQQGKAQHDPYPVKNTAYHVDKHTANIKTHQFGLCIMWFKFLLGLNFMFLLFLGKVMYDNEFERIENKS